MIKIDITNKIFYTTITLSILITLVIGVYAYNSNLAPSKLGHSLNEIEFPECLTGETIIYDGTNWICGAPDINWQEILDIPSDFQDNTDNIGAPYTAGTGIAISSNNVISSAILKGRKVYQCPNYKEGYPTSTQGYCSSSCTGQIQLETSCTFMLKGSLVGSYYQCNGGIAAKPCTLVGYLIG
ncbi:MAG: hypothetical protein OQK82_08665 [Candidatus Pacearchaeota archaeon]|nr:hypothetical protein [Candidatus Pacearchaeota archaeon]